MRWPAWKEGVAQVRSSWHRPDDDTPPDGNPTPGKPSPAAPAAAAALAASQPIGAASSEAA